LSINPSAAELQSDKRIAAAAAAARATVKSRLTVLTAAAAADCSQTESSGIGTI
tara:strand:- start:255 stop:416 length:162 start_codon:yes stop_codon:yes gene_type:complete